MVRDFIFYPTHPICMLIGALFFLAAAKATLVLLLALLVRAANTLTLTTANASKPLAKRLENMVDSRVNILSHQSY